MTRRFYRIVRTNPPTTQDFTTHLALGRSLRRPTPEDQRIASGISVFATLPQARRHARKLPMLGGYIAEIELPDELDIRVERTGGPGHHTLWGDARIVLDQVRDIMSVSE
ncbi:MAG: hypothetical protein ACKVVP_20045 [Chloroflexota bacterium]